MMSFEVVTKTVQAITTELTDYTKRSLENSTKTYSIDSYCARL
jgi:hypothetical protein